MRTVNRLLARVRDEQGFTLLPVMGLVLALMLLSAAALAQSSGDGKPSLRDRDQKEALAAAQAGIQDYLARLRQNNTYWTLCRKPATYAAGDPQRNAALNDATVTYDQRGWANVGGPSTARFSIDLLPAPGSGYTKCDPNKATDSMIDKDSGAFRIRVTGEVRATGNKDTRVRRSLIASFRPRGFLDYIYFTDYETMDPAWYWREAYGRRTQEDHRGTAPNGSPLVQRDVVGWATEQCSKYYFEGRAGERFTGTGSKSRGIQWFDSKWYSTPSTKLGGSCGEIQFVSGDKILGPFHTNDSINICGSPQFGEASSDRIEMRGGSDPDGWRAACGGSDPKEVGTWVPQADFMQIPSSNTQLFNDAEEAYRFRGQTYLTFKDTGKVIVTGRKADGVKVTNLELEMPRNGVIYVSNDPNNALCGSTQKAEYNTYEPHKVDEGCGNAIISGTYSQSVTIGAERDIVIAGDYKRKDDTAMGGLIANGFVRIKHPIKWDESQDPPRCSEDGPQLNDVTVHAAILSLNHSFTVDGYFCGVKRGTLHIFGAIAQKYRGPVGTGGSSSGGTGYLKDYVYDRRLMYRSPPRFMNPAGAQWTILSTVEQIPAVKSRP